MDQIIEYLKANRKMAMATVAFAIVLLLWVMGGDDEDQPCKACWAVLVVAGVAAGAYFMMTRKKGMMEARQAQTGVDDFVTSYRSYYAPHKSRYS